MKTCATVDVQHDGHRIALFKNIVLCETISKERML